MVERLAEVLVAPVVERKGGCRSRALWELAISTPLACFCWTRVCAETVESWDFAEAMALAANSEAVFIAHLTEVNMADLIPKFRELGWMTFGDFGFACSSPQGAADAEVFHKEVIEPLVGSDKKYVAKLRRLFAQAYSVASADTERYSGRGDVELKLHPAEREDRRSQVAKRITGFKLCDGSDPSFKLVDRMANILLKKEVKYVAWEKCTARKSELIDVPENKELQLSDSGNLVAADNDHLYPDADVSTDHLLYLALRRRSLAAEISGLCSFDAMQLWHETLLQAVTNAPPPGYSKPSFAQLRRADEELFKLIGEECRSGCGRLTADGPTRFEEALKSKMFDFNLRMLLVPLPAHASRASSHQEASSSSGLAPEVRKLQSTIQSLRGELNGLKRKQEAKGKSKGKYDRKRTRGGADRQSFRMPAGLVGKKTTSKDGRRLCWDFNLKGCSKCAPGMACDRGLHQCAEPGCDQNHPMYQHH